MSVGLKYPPPSREVLLEVRTATITQVVEHGGRRGSSAERPVITHMDPASAGVGPAFCENRHRGVVAAQPFGGDNRLLKAITDSLYRYLDHRQRQRADRLLPPILKEIGGCRDWSPYPLVA